jgi:hypothetical protein
VGKQFARKNERKIIGGKERAGKNWWEKIAGNFLVGNNL